MTPTDLPEAAGRRLASKAFSSGLSVADFAACLHMGMRPVGLVQGFCVMGWNTSLYRSGGLGGYGYAYGYDVVGQYPCPHPWGAHEAGEIVTGTTFDATALAAVWAEGYNSAHGRMLEEAAAVGAHGVIGVVDATKSLIGQGVREFHLLGTAVVIDGAEPPAQLWSTYLAGAKLAKLFEAGLVPVSVAGAFCELVVQPGCVTEIQERGRWDTYGLVQAGGEIAQLADAATLVRQQVRERLRATLGDCSLHGADLRVSEHHTTLTAVLRGTKVRRVRDVAPLPAPVPTVHLT